MSRTGCCYDGAPIESFFHTLKVELVHQRRWATREEARRDLFAYIEGYYGFILLWDILPPNRPNGMRPNPVSREWGKVRLDVSLKRDLCAGLPQHHRYSGPASGTPRPSVPPWG
jgi:hypothetical protein